MQQQAMVSGVSLFPFRMGGFSTCGGEVGRCCDIIVERERERTRDAALTVLGSPVSFQGGPPQLAAEMGARARAAWGKNKDLLTAKTALKRRLQLHNVLVRQSALWAAETWPIQSTLLKAANTQQLQQVRCMIGGGEHRGKHGRTGTPERSEWPGYTFSRTK